MAESGSLRTLLDGIWSNNPGLVQFLGLCPLLAVTNTTINGLGLGLATLAVLVLSNLLVSLCRNIIPNEVRLPVFVLIIASLVTVIELLFKAFLFDLYLSLGIFIPLIVTNCAILARAEAFASRHSPGGGSARWHCDGSWFYLAIGYARRIAGTHWSRQPVLRCRQPIWPDGN